MPCFRPSLQATGYFYLFLTKLEANQHWLWRIDLWPAFVPRWAEDKLFQEDFGNGFMCNPLHSRAVSPALSTVSCSGTSPGRNTRREGINILECHCASGTGDFMLNPHIPAHGGPPFPAHEEETEGQRGSMTSSHTAGRWQCWASNLTPTAHPLTPHPTLPHLSLRQKDY